MVGVIDVGGGMRDIYGAGVFDYCMQHGISFDSCYGISAGSANVVSYMAGQEGRNFHFYTEYAFRKEYMSWEEFFRKGSFVNLEYIYGTLSNSGGEYPLDYESMKKSGKKLCVVATNAKTGRPEYFSLDDVSKDDYSTVMASSCLPIVNKPQPFRGNLYFDGGLTDPIPIRRAIREGCDKVVVILTRPKDLYRKPNGDIRAARVLLRTYPNAAKALARRSKYYNHSLDICKKLQEQGRVLIVAPDDIGKMKTLTKDREVLELMYQKGWTDAKAIEEFLAK